MTAGIALLLAGCLLPPFSDVRVSNSIQPSTVASGGVIQWQVDIRNDLELDLFIERCVVSEEATDGWAKGSYEFLEELPITNTVIAARSTETIYVKAKPVVNRGPNQIEITNTVTVYTSSGESYSDTCTYSILAQ